MVVSFDRVNHDILLGMLAQRIADPRVLALIRRYLPARQGGAQENVGLAPGAIARATPRSHTGGSGCVGALGPPPHAATGSESPITYRNSALRSHIACCLHGTRASSRPPRRYDLGPRPSRGLAPRVLKGRRPAPPATTVRRIFTPDHPMLSSLAAVAVPSTNCVGGCA